MSEQEQNESAGRTVREHAENKRKLALLASELERYEKAFKALADSLLHNVSSDLNARAVRRDLDKHVVLASLDLKPLVAFLDEYTEVRQAVDRGSARLRELGV